MDLDACFDLVSDVAAGRGRSRLEKLSEAEIDALLELARAVAHASERKATPIVAFALGRTLGTADSDARVALMREATARLDGRRDEARREER